MTLRNSWIDSTFESTMATILAIEIPSLGSWGCRRIASRRASPARVDPGVTAMKPLWHLSRHFAGAIRRRVNGNESAHHPTYLPAAGARDGSDATDPLRRDRSADGLARSLQC